MTKEFPIKMTDLPNMVDAFFVGDQDEQGWVIMSVSDQGRAYVDALFPDAHIAWRDTGADYLPADWHGFHINVPDVVAAIKTRLPLEITGGANLDEAHPATRWLTCSPTLSAAKVVVRPTLVMVAWKLFGATRDIEADSLAHGARMRRHYDRASRGQPRATAQIGHPSRLASLAPQDDATAPGATSPRSTAARAARRIRTA
jgi:hypothetical protein